MIRRKASPNARGKSIRSGSVRVIVCGEGGAVYVLKAANLLRKEPWIRSG